ncbi:MAG: gliding motility-associated C-terminal domain-containing protein, partial [Flavobacteriales bacterium]|nr:gliding motility-associated C-terminal domain-containing protein [Flavobacteriales bacterium]
FPDTGIYLVTLIANPGYPCADTADIELTIYGAVLANILSNGDACFDVNSFNFEATGQFGGGSTFLWEFENGQPATSTEMNPQGIVFDSLGTTSINLTVVENACTGQAQAEVTTYMRPVAFFDPETFFGCLPLTISLFDSSFSSIGHAVRWDFGDGHGSSQLNPQHTYVDTGTFDLTLTIWTTSGCIDTSVFGVINAVRVNALPSGEMTVTPDTQSIFNPDFQFFGTSDDAVSCTLIPEPDNSDIAYWAPITGCEFEYTYTDTGTYYPKMNFTDQNGCVFTDVVRVRVEPEVRFFLPNAFTPNDDWTNDTWGAKTMGWRTYDLRIYDRWGKQIFQTADPDHWWNGRVNNNGNLNPVLGVYVYQIRASSVKHTHINQVGTVTIVQ